MFAKQFNTISLTFRHDNDLRTSKIEEFLILEAKKIGVIKSKTRKINMNPNRWAKHLAPWFEESCREAKATYKKTKRRHGKNHNHTKIAYTKFKECCKTQRALL
jgi:hypothetical protein